MRVKYAQNIRPGPVNTSMNRPFANRAAGVGGPIDAAAVEIDDNQVARCQAPPAHRTRLDQDPFLVKFDAEMSAQSVAGSFGGVQDFAGVDQVFTGGRLRRGYRINHVHRHGESLKYLASKHLGKME